MTLADLSPLANHLWQSTLCAAIAWLLTLTLRKNRAAVRYSIWLAASAKFLIPFSLLVGAGSQLGWRATPAIAQPQFPVVMDEISRPFATPPPAVRLAGERPASDALRAILLGAWLCGFTIALVSWFRLWWSVRAIERTATPLTAVVAGEIMALIPQPPTSPRKTHGWAESRQERLTRWRFDALTAATALVAGMPLIHNNPADFEAIRSAIERSPARFPRLGPLELLRSPALA